MMTVDLTGVTTVLMAGTGSDDDYVYRAFAAPLHAVGAVVLTPAPDPYRLIAGYLAALTEATAAAGRIAVGGVSIGAAIAAHWALAHPDSTVAVLAALPAWSGAPGDAVAALAARASAHQLRTDGLAATITAMRESSPAWLAEELARSWTGQWPGLPDAMEEAAGFVAPTVDELRTLSAPMGIAAAVDDPIHPGQVGYEWAAAAPRAALQTVTLDEIGADPARLGAACLTALSGL